jgi:hypothetical protein
MAETSYHKYREHLDDADRYFADAHGVECLEPRVRVAAFRRWWVSEHGEDDGQMMVHGVNDIYDPEDRNGPFGDIPSERTARRQAIRDRNAARRAEAAVAQREQLRQRGAVADRRRNQQQEDDGDGEGVAVAMPVAQEVRPELENEIPPDPHPERFFHDGFAMSRKQKYWWSMLRAKHPYLTNTAANQMIIQREIRRMMADAEEHPAAINQVAPIVVSAFFIPTDEDLRAARLLSNDSKLNPVIAARRELMEKLTAVGDA